MDGEFGCDVSAKINAAELLDRELDPARRRKPLKKGFIVLGGGVGDSYQPVERKLQLTRRVLEAIAKRNWPVHVLTKSTPVERDLDLLEQIAGQAQALISFSLYTVDDGIATRFEPGVPPPAKRLALLERLRRRGFPAGIFLLPVLPGISDSAEKIDEAVRVIKSAGGEYVIFGGLTLKNGRQKDYYYRVLAEHAADLPAGYDRIYGNDKWGNARSDYYEKVNRAFTDSVLARQIPGRIPQKLWDGQVNDDDRVILLLNQIDYLLRQRGQKSPYGYAAYSLSQSDAIPETHPELINVKGVGPATEKIVAEIRRTGTSGLYQKLITIQG